MGVVLALILVFRAERRCRLNDFMLIIDRC
jgi:hypothetical protein